MTKNRILGSIISIKIRILVLTLTLGLAAPAVCLAGDTKAEQALRDADAAWSKAAGSKDLGKTMSYYSSDAIVLPPNAAIATTKEEIKKIWQEMLANSGLVISWGREDSLALASTG
ncbi:MAG TPA: hypothetical protein VK639_22205 [Terriglobales bacterium]|nr:hypothetical protein [Terriglobales bacterium]